MNSEINTTINTLPPFKYFCSSIGAIPSSYLETMSYDETLIWLCNYLKETVIPTVNNTGNAVTELQNLYMQLEDYVNHYFDNLDVQEEINNKLDDMATSGQLTEIIKSYVDPIFEYETSIINQRLMNQDAKLNNQDAEILRISNKVNSVASGSPIPVSSTAGMTDTSKIYVNTTDGNWYYHNGTEWAIGGVYQSSGIGMGDVHFNNLDDNLSTKLFGFSSNIENIGWGMQNYNASAFKYSSCLYIKKGTTLSFGETFLTNYHWALRRFNTYDGSSTSLKNNSVDSSYTFLNDEIIVITFQPIDNNWNTETYTVDSHYIPTNNDIELSYYYPLNNGYLLADLNGSFVKNLWQKGNYVTSSGNFFSANNRMGISTPLQSQYPIRVTINSGYNAGFISWRSKDIFSENAFISDSGWLSQSFIIPANTIFTLSVRKSDNTNLVYSDAISNINLSSYVDFSYVNNYVNGKLYGDGNYSFTGEKIDLLRNNYFNATQLFRGINPGEQSNTLQGFDIYDGKIFQLNNHDIGIQVRDLSYGTVLGLIPITGLYHGETGQFSNTFYDPNDYAPLLYTVSDTTPAIVSIVRIIDLTQATIIKQYTLESDDGYYSGQCFDFINNKIISIGYKLQNFRNATGNNMIVSIYDMGQETLIDGINYSLELLQRYEIPFLYCVQGQKFLNGKCWLVSSYLTAEQPTRIYIFDAYKNEICNTITDLPTEIITTEAEDLAFTPNDHNNYDVIIFTRRYYTRLTFN